MEDKLVGPTYQGSSYSQMALKESSEYDLELPVEYKLSCSSRKDSNSGRWTQEERMLFLKGVMLHGNSWKKVNN